MAVIGLTLAGGALLYGSHKIPFANCAKSASLISWMPGRRPPAPGADCAGAGSDHCRQRVDVAGQRSGRGRDPAQSSVSTGLRPRAVGRADRNRLERCRAVAPSSMARHREFCGCADHMERSHRAHRQSLYAEFTNGLGSRSQRQFPGLADQVLTEAAMRPDLDEAKPGLFIEPPRRMQHAVGP